MLDDQVSESTAPANAVPGLGVFSIADHVSLSVGDVEARWVLRLSEADANEIGALSCFDLSGPINSARASTSDELENASARAFRLGPDEWLLNAPAMQRAAVTAAMDRTLANRPHALVDVSDRNVSLRLNGPDASVVLASACPIDLGERNFPVGYATRTVFGKAEIILHRSEAGFEVQVWRSFARYVSGILKVNSELNAAATAMRRI